MQKQSDWTLAPAIEVANCGHATHAGWSDEKLAQDPTAQAHSLIEVEPEAELEPAGHGLQCSGAGSPYRLELQMHAASPLEAPAAECDPGGHCWHSTTTDKGYGGGKVSLTSGHKLVEAVVLENSEDEFAACLAITVSFLQYPELQRQPEMLRLY